MYKKWDFYLTDEKRNTYLYFKLMSYHFGTEEAELFPGKLEGVVRFAYVAEPEAILGKPNGTVFTFEEFIEFFFEREEMERYGHGEIMLECANGKLLYIERGDSVEQVIEIMNGGTAELVMKYGAVLSLMNPMAHLIYWKQLEDEIPENICLEDPEDINGLYWLGYNKELKCLGFAINGTDYLKSFSGRELTEISVSRGYEFCEFKRFDFIRGVSRWFKLSNFIDCLGEVDIRVHYQSGKEEQIIVDDADDLKLLLKRLSKPNAKIKGVYIENVDENQIKGMVKENYFETHRWFVDITEGFPKKYKKIPAIAENDQIIEEV